MKKIIFLVVAAVLAAGAWFYFTPPGSDSSEKIFTIEKGEGVHEISQNLKDQGFIKDKFFFEAYVWYKKIQSKFQAGEHILRQNMRVWEVTDTLIAVNEPGERNIKIIEGWNNNEIAGYLEKEGVVGKDIFLAALNDYDVTGEGYEFLDDRPEGAALEGYLFPDTYRIYKEFPTELLGERDKDSATAGQIIEKMLDNFGQKLSADMRTEISRQKKTIFEIITMASVIEKEARGDDMAMVSDIFWRRIDAGIPLQSDATVNYATGKYETQPSLDDLGADSPYNTYKYRGLPAGPIGNPGLDAITAAIYPKANKYWYFLHAKDGQTIYSKTFEEHKANKAKYL